MMSTQEHTNDQAHQALRELLPWFVNDTLSSQQKAMVDDHLRGCAQCRQDVEWQRSLAAAVPGAPEGLDMERALGRLMPRLEARPASPSPLQRLRTLWADSGWMPWALAGQAALIALLAVHTTAPDARQSDYRALGAAHAGAAGNLVVAFRPGATLADLQRLTRANDARVVDGPTVTGAYVLHVVPARQAEVAAAFKADPAVVLAEPLAPGAVQ